MIAMIDRKPQLYFAAICIWILGAVSFPSWRGCSDQILAGWRDAARTLNVLVGEWSTDAAPWRYPRIFSEQSFALHEISPHTRILAISQPKSILQWQLTADYSLLAGGGICGDNGPLRPTQRFWNLKQLASTPPRHNQKTSGGCDAAPVVAHRRPAGHAGGPSHSGARRQGRNHARCHELYYSDQCSVMDVIVCNRPLEVRS